MYYLTIKKVAALLATTVVFASNMFAMPTTVAAAPLSGPPAPCVGQPTTTVVTQTRGGINVFKGAPKGTHSPVMPAYIASLPPGAQRPRLFDDLGIDASLIQRFDLNLKRNVGGVVKNLCEITLEINVRPSSSSMTFNDGVGLAVYQNTVFAPVIGTTSWGSDFPSLTGLPSWSAGGPAKVITLNLSSLPLVGGGNLDFIPNSLKTPKASAFNQRYFDLYIQDDTDVDYAKVMYHYN